MRWEGNEVILSKVKEAKANFTMLYSRRLSVVVFGRFWVPIPLSSYNQQCFRLKKKKE